MARRDLLRHPWRTLLTALLVALPICIATAVSLLHHNDQWVGEKAARDVMGGADALVRVTKYAETRPAYTALGHMTARPARSADGGEPIRRDRSLVNLDALLPEGSSRTSAPGYANIELATGGATYVALVDAADPITIGVAPMITAGRAPEAPREIAVTEPVAAELRMLSPTGGLLPDAAVRLADGRELHVVGLIDRDGGMSGGMLAASDSVLASGRPAHEFLVDLPNLSRPALHGLVDVLAAQGVAMMPRGVVFHPHEWDARGGEPDPANPASLAIGAAIILFGLLEVVLLVGSAFAVAARRQIRDLGLVASTGGTQADVRRIVLAQGLVLGVGASTLGVIAGIGLFPLAVPIYEELLGTRLWTRDVAWPVVVGLALLGSTTGLVAALAPARSISKLTPVQALSGRFASSPAGARAHRAATMLVVTGLLLLGAGGVWTAREYAPRPGTTLSESSPVPVGVSALGLLVFVAGIVWSSPYIVDRCAQLARIVPVSARHAVRDAVRHRFRTAAAATALMISVAGAVFAGFVLQSTTAPRPTDDLLPPRTAQVHLQTGWSPERVAPSNVVDEVRHVLGPLTVTSSPESRQMMTVRARHPITESDLERLQVYGIFASSDDPLRRQLAWTRWMVLAATAVLTLLVSGVAVALASAEQKRDVATLAAIGAGPWRRRGLGAAHGVFLGTVGAVLGVLVGTASGASLTQVDRLPGAPIPWTLVAATLLIVPIFAAAAGWLVTPTRLPLVRRSA